MEMFQFVYVSYQMLDHILPKAQVTSNKIEPKRRLNFLAWPVMPLHVVWYILF